MESQAILHDRMVLLAEHKVQVGVQGELHGWVGPQPVLCDQAGNRLGFVIRPLALLHCWARSLARLSVEEPPAAFCSWVGIKTVLYLPTGLLSRTSPWVAQQVTLCDWVESLVGLLAWVGPPDMLSNQAMP